MTKRYKNILIGLMLSTVMILGACSDENASASGDSNYPESVQNGKISVEYYEQIDKFYTNYPEFVNRLGEYIDKESEDISLLHNEEHVRDKERAAHDFDNFLIGLRVPPETKADHSINKKLEKVIENQHRYNELAYLSGKTDIEEQIKVFDVADELILSLKDLRGIVDMYNISN